MTDILGGSASGWEALEAEMDRAVYRPKSDGTRPLTPLEALALAESKETDDDA